MPSFPKWVWILAIVAAIYYLNKRR